jgi:quercetin dioxygenase-like cupin family protein
MRAWDDDPEGGDQPGWAHPFEGNANPSEPDGTGQSWQAATVGGSGADPAAMRAFDLAAVARDAAGRGPAWTQRSEDLDVNLLVFGAGEGVAAHANAEVDVLLVGVAGEGVVRVEGRTHSLRAGQAVLVPKGTRRGTLATTDRFAYLTCHRRRGGLQPTARPPR